MLKQSFQKVLHFKTNGTGRYWIRGMGRCVLNYGLANFHLFELEGRWLRCPNFIFFVNATPET